MPATFFYEKNDAFEALASGDDAVFESNVRFLVFAASVGFAEDRWTPDPDDNGEIRWSYINQNQRLSVIAAALAYSRTQNPQSILAPEDQIDVLTKYGAGGSRLIQREVVEKSGSNLDNLIDFLQARRNEDEFERRMGKLEQLEQEVSTIRSTD